MWLLLVACAPEPPSAPAWAYDPIWLEPAAAEGVHGFQTWELFGAGWEKRYDDRYYVCAVVVEVTGVPAACDVDACTEAWSVTVAPADTDCDPELALDPLFSSLLGVALGGPAPDESAPWPGQTTVGWADYGNGWEVHGDAYPEVLDAGGSASGAWDGVEPFLFVPASAFTYPP